jgi:hypothetical protein
VARRSNFGMRRQSRDASNLQAWTLGVLAARNNENMSAETKWPLKQKT